MREDRVMNSRGDGFNVSRYDHNSVLKRNVAIGAGDDGFDINGPSAKLAGNRAMRNDDLGIAAAQSSIDGGGNVARHNGDPSQCTNIPCS